MDNPSHITISRTTSNVEPYQYMTVAIRNGTEWVTVELTMADFALAVTGMGAVPVEVRRWPTEDPSEEARRG